MPAFEHLLFKQVFNTMDLGVLVVDEGMQVISWNSWLEAASGRSIDTISGKSFEEVFPEMINSRAHSAIKNGIQYGFPALISHSLNKSPFALFRTEDSGEQSRIDQSIIVQPLTEECGKRYVVVQITDVSYQVKREALLRAQVQLEQAALESITTVLNSLDALVYVSDMDTYELIFTNEYGMNAWGPILGKKCYQCLQANQDHPCHFCTNKKLVDEHGMPTGIHVWEFQNTVNQRWYQCRDQAIKWIDGRIVRLEVAVDITEIKQNEERLETARNHAEELAMNDSLTKTGNRRAFFDHTARQFAYLERNGKDRLSLVMLDVDFFKNINDKYGHATGDEALIKISETIQKSIRTTDRLFRIGGEEFVMVMMDCDERQATIPAECTRTAIMDIELFCNEERINLSCSLGISQYRPNVEVDELLAEADKALYFAKQNGRNQCRLFSELPLGI